MSLRSEARNLPSARARRRLALGVAALVAWSLVLAGCAPAVAGGSANTPVRPGPNGVAVAQGGSYYLRFDLDMEQLGLAPRDLQATLWVPSGYASEVGDVTAMFGMHDATVAAGWRLELVQVKAERATVTTSASFGRTRVDHTLWAVVRVDVPTGIVPGPYRFRATLQTRSGRAVPLAATLTVAAD